MKNISSQYGVVLEPRPKLTQGPRGFLIAHAVLIPQP